MFRNRSPINRPFSAHCSRRRCRRLRQCQSDPARSEPQVLGRAWRAVLAREDTWSTLGPMLCEMSVVFCSFCPRGAACCCCCCCCLQRQPRLSRKAGTGHGIECSSACMSSRAAHPPEAHAPHHPPMHRSWWWWWSSKPLNPKPLNPKPYKLKLCSLRKALKPKACNTIEPQPVMKP